MLTEVCVVGEPDGEVDGAWKVAKEKSGKILGCATKDREVQSYTRYQEKANAPEYAETVNF